MTEPNDRGAMSGSPSDAEPSQSDVTANPQTAEVAKQDAGNPTDPVEAKDDKQVSMGDAIKAALEKSEGSSSGPDQKKTEAADESEEPEEEGDPGKDDPKEAEPKAEDEKVPFHNHPRWKEVTRQKQEAEAKAAELQPRAEQFDKIDTYLRESQLGDQDFVRGLEIMRMIKMEPEKALQALDSIRANLGQFLGETLPEDLAEEVNDGILPENRAKELAKTRAQAKTAQEQAQLSQQQAMQREQARMVAEVQQSVAQWEQAQVASDPDWSKKSMFIEAKVRAEAAIKPPANKLEAIEMLKRAKSEVDKALGAFVPKPKPQQSMRSSGSSVTSNPQPKSFADAVRLAIEGTN